jgi:hypothetical protein
MSRSDAEYILMGKIMEKSQELLSLNNSLYELQQAAAEKCEEVAAPPPEAEEVYEEELAPVQEEAEAEEAAPPVPISSPPLTSTTIYMDDLPAFDEILPVRKSNFIRKNISFDKKLQLVENDHILSASISAGNNITVRWGKHSSVPAWSNGRKYDPTTGKIFRIRTELRKGHKNMRELSGLTGYALDTLKDIIREMDKQGFFTNT